MDNANGPKVPGLSRRRFSLALTAAGAGAATPLLGGQAGDESVAKRAKRKTPQNANATPQNTSLPKKREQPPEVPPFGESIEFKRQMVAPRVEPFRAQDVRLLEGPFLEAQQANLAYLKRLDSDRLLHNFRVTAGLPSPAQPLGGWEKPDCELRGHFVGHFLSACALMYAGTGDDALKTKGSYVVAELAKCQDKLGGKYLSAFPIEFFDRLNARQKVWAPFYTIHKIMAGLYDMHVEGGNGQALDVLKGMADWADSWTAPIPEPHMQDILNTEYGGMNDILYKLAALTGEDHYAVVGDRFTKKKFFNPLGLRRDELRGLHVNTHIPQVIGAAQRYEISGDERFHDVADFFWYEVTSARAYVTGGTSNGEAWLVEPRRLAAELKLSTDTTECCCAYNMLKLTRHLYEWTADPRYFDYYERTLFNHRLGAIDVANGHTQYYLSIVPAAWRTFNTENDSFWCCTGTGVEEFSKLNDSVYFHDDKGLYVNLFAPSELSWKDRGIKVRQETRFPESSEVTLTISAATPVRLPIRIRIPYWTGDGSRVAINGTAVDATPTARSYFTLEREWKEGDRIELRLPMSLHVEKMPDDQKQQALLYGPLVLAERQGAEEMVESNDVGPMGPDLKAHPLPGPEFHVGDGNPASWVKPVAGETLTFRTQHQANDATFVPFNRVLKDRYSIYWTAV